MTDEPTPIRGRPRLASVLARERADGTVEVLDGRHRIEALRRARPDALGVLTLVARDDDPPPPQPYRVWYRPGPWADWLLGSGPLDEEAEARRLIDELRSCGAPWSDHEYEIRPDTPGPVPLPRRAR